MITILVFLLLSLIFGCACCISGISIGGFTDVPGLLVVTVTGFAALISSGLVKDFFSSFRTGKIKKNEYTQAQLKRMNMAISLVMKSLLVASAAVSFMSTVLILNQLDDHSTWGMNVAVSLLSFYYSCCVIIFLLPLQSRIQRKMNTAESVENSASKVVHGISFVNFFIPIIGIILVYYLLFTPMMTLNYNVLSNYLILVCIFFFFITAILSSIELALSASLKSFFFALRISFSSKKDFSANKIKDAEIAVSVALKSWLAFSGFLSILTAIVALCDLSDHSEIPLRFSIPLGILFGGCLASLVLLAIKAKIEKLSVAND